MNIVMTIHHDLDPNTGAPGVTMRLADAYRDLGHDVEILSLCQMPARWPGLLKTVVFPAYVAWRIERARRQRKVDVVDASTGDAWLWALQASRPRPMLVTRNHGLEHVAHESRLREAQAGKLHLSWKYPLYRGSFKLREVAWSLRSADLALLLNKGDARYTVDKIGVEEKIVRVVPNGIHRSFVGLPEPEPFRRPQPLRIAMVGSWANGKGVKYASQAINRFLSKYKDASVSILGSGKSRREVVSSFAASIADQIDVVPRYQIECLPAMLRGHHVLLFPSLSEGFPGSVLEAMACGLAPVVAAVSGSLEIVTDDVDGVVVPPRNATALDQALENLFANPQTLNRLRSAAHRRAQQFEWQRVAQDQIDMYEEVASE